MNSTQILPDNSRRWILPNTFYEAKITLIPTSGITRILQTNILHEHRSKNSWQHFNISNLTSHKISDTAQASEFYSRNARLD